MVMDLAVELIHATVQLEQPLGDGTRTVGTGFLISTPGPDGAPRTVLVTANHVLHKMQQPEARIGYRISNPDGSWSYAPKPLKIRDKDGAELWTQHPSRDVAAIVVKAPPEFARAAIPLNYLAGDDTFDAWRVGAGNEMMALGFPRGLSANSAGFPILRSGRVASYPLGPAAAFPTFLLDFSVFPGNSGGPVFVSRAQNATGLTPISDAAPGSGFIAGLLTQQVELNNERLEIGIVTHARYIRETIALLQGPLPLAPAIVAEAPPVAGARAAAAQASAQE
ncbi:serine protease [Phenylobacterium sp.]|uniref:trypsin-like serine peptidase n=1 Tax=Phenylobacterium sp. TaxID=1871053 RepID=UPI00301E0BF6